MDKQTALKLLELSPDATRHDAKKSYRRLAKKFHPDLSARLDQSDTDLDSKMKALNGAYRFIVPLLKKEVISTNQAPPEKTKSKKPDDNRRPKATAARAKRHEETGKKYKDRAQRSKEALFSFFKSFFNSFNRSDLNDRENIKGGTGQDSSTKDNKGSQPDAKKKDTVLESGVKQSFKDILAGAAQNEGLHSGVQLKKKNHSPGKSASSTTTFKRYRQYVKKRNSIAPRSRRNQGIRADRIEPVSPVPPVDPVSKV
jgi:DnaJ-class molecular chaperone